MLARQKGKGSEFENILSFNKTLFKKKSKQEEKVKRSKRNK